MEDIVWKLSDGKESVTVYDVDPSTRQLIVRKTFWFTRAMSVEDARRFVESNYPTDTSDVRLAADSIGRFTARKK
jgi:hypothetical protein